MQIRTIYLIRRECNRDLTYIDCGDKKIVGDGNKKAAVDH